VGLLGAGRCRLDSYSTVLGYPWRWAQRPLVLAMGMLLVLRDMRAARRPKSSKRVE
jgi:hypothetical protein